MVLQLGIALMSFITAVSGVQIWAEYAQSLPVFGITATDAYQININGTDHLCPMPLCCAPLTSDKTTRMVAGLGTTGLFDYLHLTASQVGYNAGCAASLTMLICNTYMHLNTQVERFCCRRSPCATRCLTSW